MVYVFCPFSLLCKIQDIVKKQKMITGYPLEVLNTIELMQDNVKCLPCKCVAVA